MKLCLPASDARGLESPLEPHFPHATTYQIFDTESRAHIEIRLGEEESENQDYGRIDVVICGSIDRRGLQHLQQHGIQVMGTGAATVSEAIAQFERGELKAADPVSGCGCGGNGGHGEHGNAKAQHGCCGGEGHGGGGCCGGHNDEHSGCGCHA